MKVKGGSIHIQDGNKLYRSFQELEQGNTEQVEALRKELVQCYIPRRMESCSLVWPLSSLGEYTVKHRYLFLYLQKGIQKSLMLEGMWRMGLIPKVMTFWWMCLRNKILTIDNLRKRGSIIANIHVLRQEGKESIHHIPLHYDYFRNV